MKISIKHLTSILALIFFLILAVGSDDTDTEKVAVAEEEEGCVPGKSSFTTNVTEHTLTGNALEVTIVQSRDYTSLSSLCESILRTAYVLAVECFPDINSLVIHHGITQTDKFGDEKHYDIGTFKPKLSELRKYKEGWRYSNDEFNQLDLVLVFNRKGVWK